MTTAITDDSRIAMQQTASNEQREPATDTAHDLLDLIIVGSGPAAWSAGIYAARGGLNATVVTSTVGIGGDLMNTTEVENYPGFADGIQGPELMMQMQQQAEKFGVHVVYDDVTALNLIPDAKTATLGSGRELAARALIFATGSAYRKLGVPGEERLSGYGVSWCATCDGFFFRDQDVAVVGGGDSALEEALFLSRMVRSVTVLVRGFSPRASSILVERARKAENIEFLYNTTVEDIQGDSSVEGLVLNTKGFLTHLCVTGVFIAIGADPRTHLVHGQLDLTDEGVIEVEGRTSRTSVPGVFAAGDVVDARYRQAITAAASGATAALDAEEYLTA